MTLDHEDIAAIAAAVLQQLQAVNLPEALASRLEIKSDAREHVRFLLNTYSPDELQKKLRDEAKQKKSPVKSVTRRATA